MEANCGTNRETSEYENLTQFLFSVEELPEQKIEMVQRASDTPMRDSKESSKVTMVD